MSAYNFKPADRLCTSCRRPLSAPMLVVMETTPPVSLVAAVHRVGCASALPQAVQAHDGQRYALGVVTANAELN